MTFVKDPEQQRYLESLQRQVSSGRRRGRWLAVAAAGVLAGTLFSWWLYYSSAVLSYAELKPSLRVKRDAKDPDRLTLVYLPTTPGNVGFRRAEAGRETELLDQVVPEASGVEQEFQWRWKGVEQGDRLRVTFRRGWSLVSQELMVPAAPPAPPLGTAVLTGQITDATNNQPVAGAVVRIVGLHLSARSDNEGRFRLAGAPSGPVPIEVSASNYSTEEVEKDLAAGAETPLRVVLSPGMKAGQMRLVLTWGREPADLDAHMEGPLPEGKRFHIYFQEKGDLKSKEYVKLDVDCRTGWGPETITVLGVLPGTYHYFVHDYTNRDSRGGSALARSGAEVKVYQGGQTYRFAADGESIGNLWNVCDIEVTAGGATVKKTNSYESRRLVTRASMYDVVFLLEMVPGMNVEQVKSACLENAERLKAGGLHCRFALIPFGEAKIAASVGTIPLTESLALFRRRVDARAPGEGGAPPATAAEALEKALALEFRPDVGVQFILLASSPQDGERMVEVASRMKRRDIKTIVYADARQKSVYAPLIQNGGRFCSLAGEEEPAAETPVAVTDLNAFQRLRPDAWHHDVKGDSGGTLADAVNLGGLYGLRTHRDEELVVQLGGSKESEKGVAEGLDWLARHQMKDGHWVDSALNARPGGCCDPGNACGSSGMVAPMAQTGLAILAFQAGGHFSFNDKKYSSVVRRGLDWLVEHQRKDGSFAPGGENDVPGARNNLPGGRNNVPRGRNNMLRGLNNALGGLNNPGGGRNSMYEHGIATFALCEACAVAGAADKKPEEAYLNTAKKAVRFIERDQHSDGGWRYTTQKAEISDTSVSGWQVLALKSALEARIPVDDHTISEAKRFFKSCEVPATGQTGYQARSGQGTDAMTGVGMLVYEFLRKTPHAPFVKTAADYLATRANQDAGSPDYYGLYNCTLAMYLAGGKPWEQWNQVIRDAVLNAQQHEGCARGSWPPGSGMGAGGGRICSTAWAVLTLEVYYRFCREPSPAKKSGAETEEGPARHSTER